LHLKTAQVTLIFTPVERTGIEMKTSVLRIITALLSMITAWSLFFAAVALDVGIRSPLQDAQKLNALSVNLLLVTGIMWLTVSIVPHPVDGEDGKTKRIWWMTFYRHPLAIFVDPRSWKTMALLALVFTILTISRVSLPGVPWLYSFIRTMMYVNILLTVLFLGVDKAQEHGHLI
jgi:hypothetical protein